VQEWETWPFEGAAVPRALEPPVDGETPRHGAGGVGCRRCERDVEGALWQDDNWVLDSLDRPSGLPCIVLLHPRLHVDLLDLPDELARELGPLLIRIQRAVFAIGDIGNVHVCRWGDGSEHLHIWFMARPARLPQLIGSFAAIWDDVLPPLPDDVWRANLEIVARELRTPVPGT
jgi:hypothetical protein